MKKKQVEHQRVQRSKTGLYTTVKTAKESKKVETTGGIDSLLKKISKDLGLKTPCPGSQFHLKIYAPSTADGYISSESE